MGERRKCVMQKCVAAVGQVAMRGGGDGNCNCPNEGCCGESPRPAGCLSGMVGAFVGVGKRNVKCFSSTVS